MLLELPTFVRRVNGHVPLTILLSADSVPQLPILDTRRSPLQAASGEGGSGRGADVARAMALPVFFAMPRSRIRFAAMPYPRDYVRSIMLGKVR